MSIQRLLSSTLCLVFFSSAALGEEVIWRNLRTSGSSAVVPDRVSNSAGPGGAEFSDYLLAQVLVQCNPGEPRVGLPGMVNGMRTFFQDDAQIDFEFFAWINTEPDNRTF